MFETGTITSTGTRDPGRQQQRRHDQLQQPDDRADDRGEQGGDARLSNAGGTINFNPGGGGTGLDISTTTGTGFSAIGGGTITVQGSGNSIIAGRRHGARHGERDGRRAAA